MHSHYLRPSQVAGLYPIGPINQEKPRWPTVNSGQAKSLACVTAR